MQVRQAGQRPRGRPYVLGITGGFASGKSTVTAMLADLGAAVVDADAIVREQSKPGGPIWRAIQEAFGPEVLDEGGEVRRAFLRDLIFRDEEARRRLNRATHPLVLEEVRRRVDALGSSLAPLVAVEIPLLFEAGWAARRLVDGVLVVWADRRTCLRRAAERGLGPEEAETALAAQMPLDEKRARADFVVDNSGSLEATRSQVEALWKALVG